MTSLRCSVVILVGGLLFLLSAFDSHAAPTLESTLLDTPWSWVRDGGREPGTIIFDAAGTVRYQGKPAPWIGRWRKMGPQTVIVGENAVIWTLNFDAGFTAFRGLSNKGNASIMGTRQPQGATSPYPPVAPVPPVPVPAPAPPAPAPGGTGAMAITPEITNFGGMALAADWMPRRTETRKELLNSLEFFATQALGKNGEDKDAVPSTILGPIRWLMPLDEAVRTLPPRVSRTAEVRITSICFPQNSLSMIGFQNRYFMDREQQFNMMYLIVDAQRRVVAVELVSQSPKEVLWAPPGPDGTRNPYYDFVNLKANGRTGQRVDFQIRPGDSGVKLIKTALFDFRKVSYLENVHWYLPAPFARSLLEIIEFNRKAGMMR